MRISEIPEVSALQFCKPESPGVGEWFAPTLQLSTRMTKRRKNLMALRALLKDNKMSAKDLSCRLSDILGQTRNFALTSVRPVFHYDENRKRTDIIEGQVYSVTDLETLSAFNVRVNSTTPVITPEELEDAEERVFVEFPLEETFVRPYKLEYGVATVSITAPYAKLVTPSDSEED